MHVFPNDKVYIGITSQNPPEKRWMSNGIGYKVQPRMWRAICKYGWDNIEHIIIARNVNIESAKNMEIDLIALYNSTNKMHGYNASPGGSMMGEESKKKLSESRKGFKLSPKHKEKLRLANLNKTPSPKAIERLKEYNATRDYSKMIQPNMKPVLQYSVTTGAFLGEYKSVNCAASQNNLDVRHINQCIKGKLSQVGGFIWIDKSIVSDELIAERLYNAQNPKRFGPYKIEYIDDNSVVYYHGLHDLCDDNSFDYGSVNHYLNHSTRFYKHKYIITKISIPEYVHATNQPFF